MTVQCPCKPRIKCLLDFFRVESSSVFRHALQSLMVPGPLVYSGVHQPSSYSNDSSMCFRISSASMEPCSRSLTQSHIQSLAYKIIITVRKGIAFL